MKKILLTVSIFAIIFSLKAQVKVEKSNDKVSVLGRNYYVHTVKEGETLYSISQAYDIPQDQIILINNKQVVNLQADDVLKIPIKDETYAEKPLIEVTFKEHTVGRKESLYAIAKQYNTSEEEILKYNPEAKRGIKKKQVLKIPVYKEIPINAQDDFFVYHKVKKGETVKSVIKKYNISKEQLFQMNPDAINGLEVGTILSIPKKELTELEFLIITGAESDVPNLLDIDPLYFTDPSCEPCKEFQYTDQKTFKVAMLIPFFLDYNYSKSLDLITEPDEARLYKNSEIFIHFYEGALLAINEMKRLGLNIDLYVYDTHNDSSQVASILAKYEMRQMDLIIGPVYSNYLDMVAEFANENRINVVSPVSKKSEYLQDNPFIFQVNPSNRVLVENTADFFTNYYDSSIVAIHHEKDAELELLKSYKTSLTKTFFNETDLDTIAFKEVSYYKDGVKGVRNALVKNQQNFVLLPSDNEVFVSNVLNQLNTLASIQKYRITVFGLPVWKNYHDLELNFYKNLNIHYPSASFVDETDWQVQKFIEDYRTNFNTDPTAFSYQGYDVTFYFLSALKRYGKFFQFCISSKDVEPNPQGLSLRFDFERINDTSGFENNGSYILNYSPDSLNLQKFEGIK